MSSDLLAAILLGLIEGFTEFLPVSSTAHLLVAQHWLGHRSEFFNIAVQAGAILAVVFVYRNRLGVLAAAVFVPAAAAPAATDRAQPPRAYLARLALAFSVTAVLGLAVKALGWELSHAVTPIAWALILGAFWMLAAEHATAGRPGQSPDEASITWAGAVLVGVAQVVAGVFPGTSRSAVAIFVLLLLGVRNRGAAAEFVFLVGIPTILAATAYALFDSLAHRPFGDMPWADIGAGFVAAFLAASCAVRWLLHFIRVHRFTGFALYRLILGLALLAWGGQTGAALPGAGLERGDSGGRPDMPRFIQGHEGVMADLPQEAVRVGKVAPEAAPGHLFRRADQGGADADGFFQGAPDGLFRVHIVGEGEAGKAGAGCGNAGIFGEGLPLEQAEDHGAGVEEGDGFLAAGGFLPAQGPIEAPAAGQIGDAQGDEAHGLFHVGFPWAGSRSSVSPWS